MSIGHLMNWEDVQIAAKTILEAIPNMNGPILNPNEKPADKEKLFIELTVSETGSVTYTEFETLWQGSIDMIVNTPVGIGTVQANTIAAKIKDRFSPIMSEKSGFQAGPYWVRVKGTRQMPSQTKDTLFRINVRVTVEIFTNEGE